MQETKFDAAEITIRQIMRVTMPDGSPVSPAAKAGAILEFVGLSDAHPMVARLVAKGVERCTQRSRGGKGRTRSHG